MKTRIIAFIAVLVMAAVAVSSAAVYAMDDSSGPKDEVKREAHFKKMSEELNLTAEQKAALEKHRAEFSGKVKELRDKMSAARKSLKEELNKAVTDRAKVNSILSELKAMMAQQMDYRVEKVLAMKEILTPEQFSKMQDKMEKHKGRMGNKHSGKGWGSE